MILDCTLLNGLYCSQLYWPGLQNKALEHFTALGPNTILQPDQCYSELYQAALLPQFSDFVYTYNSTIKMKQEFLLSIALEYNYGGLLKECARVWADGSHLGDKKVTDDGGLSLSTLTEWIWNRATFIKKFCNNLCIPLFDHSGASIDLHSQKKLSHCARQLKLLADLMEMIITDCQQYIPNEGKYF